ncbi:M48 family metalloprotease [Alphaproteobacteria bacterium]|nr:M48 family metalloprotease [Alphaproteobacteria bacterium]
MIKLAGGRKSFIILLIYFTLIFSKNTFAVQIYDYHTEKFIKKLNYDIITVNSYNKKINFRIYKDGFPNAYVTEDNLIYLSSGLLTYSPNYVSLLGVLAHEIGHLEKYHVSKRKKEIKNLTNISTYSNLAAVVGSMIIQEPSILNAIAVNQTAVNNLFINFSQEQEIEADFYAIDTINKLKLPTKPLKEFLLTLENKTDSNLIDEELKKFSTHPIFEKRYEIIDNNTNGEFYNFNKEYQREFDFIQAKFMAYTDSGMITKLKNDQKIYYDSIQLSKSGNLLESLKKINLLISKNKEDYFIEETKADILLSYGYNNEAIKFYKKVLHAQPDNNYAKYNIFVNSTLNQNDYAFNKNFFLNNINLLKYFPNNQNVLIKYYNLAKFLKYNEWIVFFETLLFQKKDVKQIFNQLNRQTKDYNLKKIIKLYT